MKEKPILFNGDMVRAVLNGRKTQTRRLFKPRAKLEYAEDYLQDNSAGVWMFEDQYGDWHKTTDMCPYGKVGDCLWVRETFVLENNCVYTEMYSEADLPKDTPYKIESDPEDGDYWLIPHYRATDPEPNIVNPETMVDEYDDRTRWTPSIFMPRWASRITLEITNIRVERLQDISEEDAKAEGVEPYPVLVDDIPTAHYDEAFARLWQSINGDGSWDKNPWVWVIEFKPVKV